MTTTSDAMLVPMDVDVDACGRKRQWLGREACVESHEGGWDVFAGGALIFAVERGDLGMRDTALAMLCQGRRPPVKRIASAFGLSVSAVHKVRGKYRAGGLVVLVNRTPRGPRPKLTGRRLAAVEKKFEQGKTPTQVHQEQSERARVSLRTLERVQERWRKRRSEEGAAAVPPPVSSVEPALEPVLPSEVPVADEVIEEATAPEPGAADEAPASSCELGSAEAPLVDEVPVADEVIEEATVPEPGAADEAPEGSLSQRWDSKTSLPEAAPRSASSVQHLGTWLMLAIALKEGLYHHALALGAGRVKAKSLRVVLDALVIALSVGERTVEGARRIATASASALLRSASAPTPSWMRRVLGRMARHGAGSELMWRVAQGYMTDAAYWAGDEPVVLYVDNHLRTYTGKNVIRRGWRMQDKRAVPGICDYWVHDEDGRPLFCETFTSNAPMTKVLTPLAQRAREAFPSGQRILLAFDRAGAYPKQLAALRDLGVEFVTYERRPYAMLSERVFDKKLELGDETFRLYEAPRRNLGSGLGRVRRIAVRTNDGRQINLLATSASSPAFLLGVMRGRWNQENAFKSGQERWGFDPLDSRTAEPYDPDALIPNPARRRLDNALRVARREEGDARRKLARLQDDHHLRPVMEARLQHALELQQELEANRPRVPKHIPVRDSELAGVLVAHTTEYKHAIDAVRIACANAESELVGRLVPFLNRPREAKRVLSNLLRAPGTIHVAPTRITVRLQPAANSDEQDAIQALLQDVNTWALRLPGDNDRRTLRFELASES